MVSTILATFFLTCLGNSPWDPRTGMMDEHENSQETSEEQSEPIPEGKPDFLIEEEGE